jgi:DeoR/GlpR family transcriptional regulator of sugar metabolism
MSKPLIPARQCKPIHEYQAICQIAQTVDLCKLPDITETAVRRDLEWLEQKTFWQYVHHGDTILNQRLTFELEYMQRTQNHFESLLAITNPISA